jgi:hypothetical protein
MVLGLNTARSYSEYNYPICFYITCMEIGKDHSSPEAYLQSSKTRKKVSYRELDILVKIF